MNYVASSNPQHMVYVISAGVVVGDVVFFVRVGSAEHKGKTMERGVKPKWHCDKRGHRNCWLEACQSPRSEVVAVSA